MKTLKIICNRTSVRESLLETCRAICFSYLFISGMQFDRIVFFLQKRRKELGKNNIAVKLLFHRTDEF